MKLEVVVIPVSDVERATKFYTKLGWRQDVTPPGSGVFQFTPPGSGCSVQWGKANDGGAGVRPGPLADRLRHPGRAGQAGRRRRPASTRSSTSARTARPAASIPSAAPIARSPRSGIRTATAGFSRRSRPGFPGASTRRRRRSAPRATWRARCGARRKPTASTRSAPDSETRTGPTGTPSTWWRSSAARSCRRERRAATTIMDAHVSVPFAARAGRLLPFRSASGRRDRLRREWLLPSQGPGRPGEERRAVAGRHARARSSGGSGQPRPGHRRPRFRRRRSV